MAPRKSTESMTLSELELQRKAIEDAIRAKHKARRENFKKAMVALASNELSGEGSITGFEIEAVIGALLDAKRRANQDPTLNAEYTKLGKAFIDKAVNPLIDPAIKDKREPASDTGSDENQSAVGTSQNPNSEQSDEPPNGEFPSHDSHTAQHESALGLHLN